MIRKNIDSKFQANVIIGVFMFLILLMMIIAIIGNLFVDVNKMVERLLIVIAFFMFILFWALSLRPIRLRLSFIDSFIVKGILIGLYFIYFVMGNYWFYTAWTLAESSSF